MSTASRDLSRIQVHATDHAGKTMMFLSDPVGYDAVVGMLDDIKRVMAPPRYYVEKAPSISPCPWMVRDREAPNVSLYLCPARFRTEEDAYAYATYLNMKDDDR